MNYPRSHNQHASAAGPEECLHLLTSSPGAKPQTQIHVLCAEIGRPNAIMVKTKQVPHSSAVNLSSPTPCSSTCDAPVQTHRKDAAFPSCRQTQKEISFGSNILVTT